MGTSNWGTGRSVEDSLFSHANEVEFFQAVRLLTQLYGERHPGAALRQAEVVRFGALNAMSFPPSSIAGLAQENGGPPRMTVTFMGLTGPQGVLPSAYTETTVDQASFGDTSLADFLDLFNHRLIWLFYQAWEKHHFVMGYEQTRRGIPARDSVTSYLFDLVGMGTEGLKGRLPFPDAGLLRYAGLLAQRPHSAEALRALLHDYFGFPIKVEQFLGKWHNLDADDLCCLGSLRPESQLGLGAVAGDAVWSRQSLVRIVFGPLSADQFQSLLPNQTCFHEATALIRWFLGPALEFEIQPTVDQKQVPPFRLGEDAFDFEGRRLAETRLGWSAWLVTEPFVQPAMDAIFNEQELVMREA
jgi:type VI secretion system protein ImpH